MKDITTLRRILADIHSLRNAALTALNERDATTMKNKMRDIRRKTQAIDTLLELREVKP